MLWSWLSIAATVITSVAAANQTVDSSTWTNLHYYRNVELTLPYVKEYDLIEAKNTSPEPQENYIFTLNDGLNFIPEVSYVSVMLTERNLELFPFRMYEGVYAVRFPEPIAPQQSVEFKIRYVYANTLAPFPEKIEMHEKQELLVKLNKYVYSPYNTEDYSLVFNGFAKGQEMQLQMENAQITPNLPLLTGRVESDALVYGPVLTTIPPYSKAPMGLVFDHPRPLTRVINLERSFWLPASGVGVVQTEDYYELTNNGAQLKNGYSRGEWMKGRYDIIREHFALSQLEFPELPLAKFEDYYFTDKVGKVSSHHPALGHIIMQPRYPLFGGWKYNFTMGWNNKIESFVHEVEQQEDYFIAKFPLLTGLREVYYDDVVLNFYLPEGAQFLSLSSPLINNNVEVTSEASYLDVSSGHVKVTVKFHNLIDEMANFDVYVKYKYTPQNFRNKVLKIAGFVFLGLTSYYFLGLLNLSIEQ